jgi:hypothetical protein
MLLSVINHLKREEEKEEERKKERKMCGIRLEK